MKSNQMKKIILIVAFLLASALEVHASGPLVVKGGMAITYGTRPFLYRYDKGTLGMFSNSDAIALTEALYANWQAVKTGSIKF